MTILGRIPLARLAVITLLPALLGGCSHFGRLEERKDTALEARVLLADLAGTWPDEYLTGHDDLYAVELFGRGLDTCVFLEGCILSGPRAGKRFGAEVPYLPQPQGDSATFVPAGP